MCVFAFVPLSDSLITMALTTPLDRVATRQISEALTGIIRDPFTSLSTGPKTCRIPVRREVTVLSNGDAKLSSLRPHLTSYLFHQAEIDLPQFPPCPRPPTKLPS